MPTPKASNHLALIGCPNALPNHLWETDRPHYCRMLLGGALVILSSAEEARIFLATHRSPIAFAGAAMTDALTVDSLNQFQDHKALALQVAGSLLESDGAE